MGATELHLSIVANKDIFETFKRNISTSSNSKEALKYLYAKFKHHSYFCTCEGFIASTIKEVPTSIR